MKSESTITFIIGLLVATFALGGLLKCSGERGMDERARAIEAGVAEWRIDAKTGVKSFHYLTPTK